MLPQGRLKTIADAYLSQNILKYSLRLREILSQQKNPNGELLVSSAAYI